MDLNGFLLTLGIVVGAGVLGGTYSFLYKIDFLAEQNKMKLLYFAREILRSMIASALTPLFLSFIGSDLPSSLFTKGTAFVVDYINVLKFSGFCLLVSVFSKSFMEGMGEKLHSMIKQNEERSRKTESEVESIWDTLTFEPPKEMPSLPQLGNNGEEKHAIGRDLKEFLVKVFGHRITPLVAVDAIPKILGNTVNENEVDEFVKKGVDAQLIEEKTTPRGRSIQMTELGYLFIEGLAGE